MGIMTDGAYNEPGAPDAADYEYPYDDDEPDDDGEDFGFECAAYWTGSEWHCPLAGTEDCDWECTETFDEREEGTS
jgi:hypothetical protein